MSHFDKVLVCVDMSPSGGAIIEKTCTIAQKNRSKEVAFLHVVRDFHLPEALQKEFPNLLDRAIEERKEELQKIIRHSFSCNSIPTKLIVKQGNLTKEILSTSEEEGTDLVVMGRYQKSDSIHINRIARRVGCKLLIVPKNKKSRLKFDKIHIPVDFSNYTDLSLDIALSLTEGNQSEIFLHNVYSVPSSYRYSGKTFEEFAKILEEHASKNLEKLTARASIKDQKLIPIHTNDHKHHNIIDAIYKEAASRKVDLIVMGAKGRTTASALFIGSKAERMIQVNHKIPLLVVRKKGSNAGILESLQEF